MAASSWSKYSIRSITRDKYKDIFFQHGAYADQSTVAYSILELDGRELNSFHTMSGDGKHAEVALIEEAEGELRYKNMQSKRLSVIIMLSKSPCFDCREKLEVFLERMKKGGALVTVTLRIANLYHGDGGSKGQIIQRLARWKNYLTNQRIIQAFILEPISVTHELSGYTKRYVSSSDWGKTVATRRKKDDEIQRQVVSINANAGLPEDDYQQQVKKNFENNMEHEEKKLFYTLAKILVFAQIQIHAENEMGREKLRICNEIICRDPECCCNAYNATCKEIQKQLGKDIPNCWTVIKHVDVIIMATHFPCTCIRGINNKYNDVTRLILRIANNQHPEQYAAHRLLELYTCRNKIDIFLEPIMVSRELIVYCDRGAEEWRKIKEERKRLDFIIVNMVQKIKSIFLHEQNLYSLQQQIGRLSISK